jgi:hypothetical protein
MLNPKVIEQHKQEALDGIVKANAYLWHVLVEEGRLSKEDAEQITLNLSAAVDAIYKIDLKPLTGFMFKK